MIRNAEQVRDAAPDYRADADAQDVPVGYKHTEVGVIPEDWDVRSVRELGTIRTGPFGTLLKAEEYSSTEGVPLISVGEIGSGALRISEHTPRIPPRVTRRLPQYVLRAGDIVFGRKGAVDRSALVAETQDGWFLGSDGICIRPADAGSARYIAWQFLRHEVQAWLLQNATGTTMASLNQAVLSQVRIPYSTAPEQRAIAEALSDVDGLLGALEALIAKKRAIKQAAMQQLLTGKTRLPGFSGEWETKRLGEVVERFLGGGTPSRANPTYWGNEIPWMTVKDFATFPPRSTQERITQSGLANSASHLIPAGTLITATRMALGKAVVYEEDVAINQDLKALILTPQVDVHFLRYWFELFGGLIDDIGGGSTVKGVSTGELSQLAFHGPSKPEQAAIATVLSDMDAEIAALEARRGKTRLIKQGMMQQLLTGRVRLVKPEAAA